MQKTIWSNHHLDLYLTALRDLFIYLKQLFQIFRTILGHVVETLGWSLVLFLLSIVFVQRLEERIGIPRMLLGIDQFWEMMYLGTK